MAVSRIESTYESAINKKIADSCADFFMIYATVYIDNRNQIAERYGDLMWYQSVVSGLNKDDTYTRMQLYNELKRYNPTMSEHSIDWIISNMIKEGILYRKQRGVYALWNSDSRERTIYVPQYSEKSKEIAGEIFRQHIDKTK